MSTFVLVHGSWHTGDAWSTVIRHLESRGHRAVAPTVAGHGKGVDKHVSHARSVQSVVDYIRQQDLVDFVLVGHSYGGTVIAKVAESVPDRVHRLVFWNAFVLRDGTCLNDDLPPHHVEQLDQLAGQTDDNTVMLPFPVWRETFINDADADLAASAYETLSPEPYGQFKEKLDLGRFYSLDIPKSFLNCTEDIALPHGEFAWHPRMGNRLGLYRLVQMSGSHEVIFTSPALLAEKIIEASRD